MRSFRFGAAGALLMLCALAAVGCNQGVREDRSLTFSPGREAGFQHGREGVFVADPAGGPPVCIFRPGPDVVAVSPPLWSADGKKLIFTTARDLNPTRATRMPADPDPAGTVYGKRPVLCTCWLRDGTAADREPRRLFDARLDHVGYVAANLAARWAPAGDAVLFLEADGRRHALRHLDLKTGVARPAFPHAAEAFLFDVAPGGAWHCCVLGNEKPEATDGVWVGRPDAADWWQVPDSAAAGGTSNSLIEALRTARPQWTPDGDRFAFVSAGTAKRGGTHVLKIGTPATRSVRSRLGHREAIRDVRWSPDGRTLGYVSGLRASPAAIEWLRKQANDPEADAALAGPHGELRLLDATAGPPRVVARGVREFVGWDGSSKHLAYVTAEVSPHRAGERRALLLTAKPDARGVVWAADGDGGRPRRLVDGWRATFPRWAPDAPRLGLWLTFEPPYSFDPGTGGTFIPGVLPPGDPAALLDVDGQLRWQPVSARERAQLGHDRLRRRDHAGAWAIYAEVQQDPAARALPGFPLFVAHCLNKLGRSAEAQEQLDEFRRSSVSRPPAGFPWPLSAVEFAPQLTRDGLAAEVFLSLGEPDEAIAFVRRSLREAPAGVARQASAVVLAQLLLLLDRRAEYLELVATTLLPGFLEMGPTFPDLDKLPLSFLVGLSLLPAGSGEFLAGVPRDRLRAAAERVSGLRPSSRDDLGRLAVDVFLEAAWRFLGDEARRARAAARVLDNPARIEYMPDGVDAAITKVLELKTLVGLAGEFR